MIKNKELLKEAMAKLARYEDLEDKNSKVNDFVSTRIAVFFEVKDAEVYGGKESVGYVEMALNGNTLMLSSNCQKYIDCQKKNLSSMLNVPVDCIRSITEEEYEMQTEDCEEELDE